MDEAQPQPAQQGHSGQGQCAAAADLHPNPPGHQGSPGGAQLPGSTDAHHHQPGSHSASGGGQHHTSPGGGSGGLHSFYAAEQPPGEGGAQQGPQHQAAPRVSTGVGGGAVAEGGVLAGLHVVMWPIPHSSVLIKRAKECGVVSQALPAALPACGSSQGQGSQRLTSCTEHSFCPHQAVLQLWPCSTACWSWVPVHNVPDRHLRFLLTLTTHLCPHAAASCYC